MEYNFHTMGATEGHNFMRTLGENVYEPCDSLPTEYQPSCYYEQVQWWQGTTNSDWQKISSWCEALSDNQANFNACYQSLGHYASAANNFNTDSVIQICDTMPTNETVALCSEGASWLIIAEPGKIPDAYSLCNRLDSPYKDCLLYTSPSPRDRTRSRMPSSA